MLALNGSLEDNMSDWYFDFKVLLTVPMVLKSINLPRRYLSTDHSASAVGSSVALVAEESFFDSDDFETDHAAFRCPKL